MNKYKVLKWEGYWRVDFGSHLIAFESWEDAMLFARGEFDRRWFKEPERHEDSL